VERPLRGLELLGAQKARRAIAQRLADAMCHVLGGIGVTLAITIQEAEGDSKTGAVPFSTYLYVSWGRSFHAQAIEDQHKIASAHVQETLKGMQRQADMIEALVAEALRPAEEKAEPS